MITIREFTQPQRRSTRQRSGFTVSGTKTGSECIIVSAAKVCFHEDLVLSFIDQEVNLIELFQNHTYIYGMGGYIKARSNMKVALKLQISDSTGNMVNTSEWSQIVLENKWARFALDITIQDPAFDFTQTYKVAGEINITPVTPASQGDEVQFFGLQYGVVDHYEDKASYYPFYLQKTHLYKPEIYYLDFRPLKAFVFKSPSEIEVSPGSNLVLKSCNRCAQFLPIDAEDERNWLAFSNHCKLRAPCEHKNFAQYRIESGPHSVPGLTIISENGNFFVKTKYGFQLECRTCKKFEVNAPLNPLRNKAQHHEDGARRRAIERLIIELAGEDPIKNFRTTHGEEFPDFILRRFGHKCFACGATIDASSMDLDHTLPLVYLWPLNETATALCKACNSQKHDKFPKEFANYTDQHLKDLAQITGIPYELLNSDIPLLNKVIVERLRTNVVWFFDEFLSRDDYQKVKEGKLVADLIYKAINKTLSREGISLVGDYIKETGLPPSTITLN